MCGGNFGALFGLHEPIAVRRWDRATERAHQVFVRKFRLNIKQRDNGETQPAFGGGNQQLAVRKSRPPG